MMKDFIARTQGMTDEQANQFLTDYLTVTELMIKANQPKTPIEIINGALETVYAEYFAMRPDPNTRACELVMEAMNEARAAYIKATGD